jgi:hypothetical protein
MSVAHAEVTSRFQSVLEEGSSLDALSPDTLVFLRRTLPACVAHTLNADSKFASAAEVEGIHGFLIDTAIFVAKALAIPTLCLPEVRDYMFPWNHGSACSHCTRPSPYILSLCESHRFY